MKRGAISLISAVALLALPATALAEDLERKEKEMVQVPAKVHETIKSETAGAKIREIERSEENGEVVYEVEFETAGKKYEMDIAPDGTVLRKDEG